MANKYSRFELKPYESQYVDPGSVQVAGVLRKRYDENRNSYDMLNRAAGSINTLDGDRHIKEAAMQKVEGDFQRTIEVGNFENAGRTVSDATNDFIGNRGLQLAQQSYTARQSEIKTIDTLRANGKQVLDFNEVRDTDPNSETFGQVIGHKTDAHSSYHQDPSTGEMVEDVYRAGSEMQLDYTERMEKLLSGIAKSGGGTILKSDIQGYVKYVTSQGVSRGKAHKVVEKALESYLGSDEGTQDYRKLTQIEGMSDEDAKLDMITRMQGVVEKQIGSISSPHYMKSNAGGGGGGADGRGYAYIGGTTVTRADVETYSDLKRDLRDKEIEVSKVPKGSNDYKRLQEEIRVLKNGNDNYRNEILANQPDLKEKMDRGEQALGDYIKLGDMLYNMTNDEDYNILSPFARMFEGVSSLFGGESEGLAFGKDGERNVSSMWFANDASEIEDIQHLFDKPGVLEHINRTNSTKYTEKDMPGIKKAAVNYLKWMQEEGNDATNELDDLTSIKQSDKIIFAHENTDAYDDVNKQLKQLSFEDFRFAFQTDEEREEAKETWEKNAISPEVGAEGKEDIIKFCGMTIPTLKAQGKMILSINGKRHVVTAKDGDTFESVSSKFYMAMGAPKEAYKNRIAKEIASGDVTVDEFINMEMEEIHREELKGTDMEWDKKKLRNAIAYSVRTKHGLSKEAWNNLAEEERKSMLAEYRKETYRPN